MNTKSKYRYASAISILACSLLVPAVIEAKTVSFNCGGNKTLSAAISALAPGDVLLVNGTCNENVVIPEEVARVTINGQNSATINGPSASQNALSVRGRNITITGFTITGGLEGISVRGGNATIASNVIEDVGRDGIVIWLSGSARIIGNTIQNNPRNGIVVNDSSSARIGFLNFEGLETVPGGVVANQIVGNGRDGIVVVRSSTASIFGNNISNNAREGVVVARGGYADIAGNAIDGNGRHGIAVVDTSAVRLGEESGTELDEVPNTTDVTNNGVFGIFCNLNSSVRGRLGTLNGVSGSSDPAIGTSSSSCVNGLAP